MTLGGDGPLLAALQAADIPVYEHSIRRFFDWRRQTPFLLAIARLAPRIRTTGAQLVQVNKHEHYPVVCRAAYLAGVPVVVHVRFRPEAAMCQWPFKAPYTPRRVFFTTRTQMRDSEEAVASAVPSDRFHLFDNGLDFEAFGRDTAARQRLRAEWGVTETTTVVGDRPQCRASSHVSRVCRAGRAAL